MVLLGEFRNDEIDGEEYLVYNNVEYPSPQIHSQNSPYKIHIEYLLLQPLFLCPSLRKFSTGSTEDQKLLKYVTSPLYDDDRYDHDHHVLPLFWCDNKQADPNGECPACEMQTVGRDYYFCVQCDKKYHKECVKSPLEIYHPSHFKPSFHTKHSLQLFFRSSEYGRCILCEDVAKGMVYYCALCNIYMHVLCATAPIPFFSHNKKIHDHALTLFPRQASLTCNVCASVEKHDLTYLCSKCDFVTHRRCLRRPKIIRISRHHHCVSFVSSLPIERWICGVCRKEVDRDYGAYTCDVCSGYVVHPRCAWRRDIWDGIELDRVPEDEYEDVDPFQRKYDGRILHFSHDPHLEEDHHHHHHHHRRHYLLPRVSKVNDKTKFCKACGLSTHKGGFYECMECNFTLHEICANAPIRKFHPLHPHKLRLEVSLSTIQKCWVCRSFCNGFVYVCSNMDCDYREGVMDVRCAMISEPFSYQGHQHPLFLSVHPDEKPSCHVCKSTENGWRVLTCIELSCDFTICIKCATLPYMVRYKHDEHYLTFCGGEEASDSDWCELCEGKLALSGGGTGFYKCEDCCTTLHTDCLLGVDPYLVAAEGVMSVGVRQTHIRRNDSPSRKICGNCQRRCPYPILLEQDEKFFCSLTCLCA